MVVLVMIWMCGDDLVVKVINGCVGDEWMCT